jgi:hypothetical protein
MPSMTESPRQITPSQSKMKTSTFGRRSLDGSVSLRTLAWRDVVEVNVLWLKVAADRNDDAAGENARADVTIKAAVRADLAMCIFVAVVVGGGGNSYSS